VDPRPVRLSKAQRRALGKHSCESLAEPDSPLALDAHMSKLSLPGKRSAEGDEVEIAPGFVQVQAYLDASSLSVLCVHGPYKDANSATAVLHSMASRAVKRLPRAHGWE
jgi:hypothetical protein